MIKNFKLKIINYQCVTEGLDFCYWLSIFIFFLLEIVKINLFVPVEKNNPFLSNDKYIANWIFFRTFFRIMNTFFVTEINSKHMEEKN